LQLHCRYFLKALNQHAQGLKVVVVLKLAEPGKILLHHEHSTAQVSDLMGYRAHQDAAAFQQMIQTQILPAAQIL